MKGKHQPPSAAERRTIGSTRAPRATRGAWERAAAERRENLLTASAAASRLLLEAPDVMAVVPQVLEIVGAAAGVDRVDLMLAQRLRNGSSRFVVAAEWTADGVAPRLAHPTLGHCDEEDLPAELRAGRTVALYDEGRPVGDAAGASHFDGLGAISKALVPIFVGEELAGVVAFDLCRESRAISGAELAALETAAGVIGAALHRERLVDAVRRERERALSFDRETVLRGLEQLASEAQVGNFLGAHVLREATELVNAASGAVIVRDAARDEWRVNAYARNGVVQPPPYSVAVPLSVTAPFGPVGGEEKRKRIKVDLAQGAGILWPGMTEYHRGAGDAALHVFPLAFGEHLVGFMVLSFIEVFSDSTADSELLIAITQGATISIELARRAEAARDTAVLAERNRIAQEIHDGIAQAFTGILLQLGAAEATIGRAAVEHRELLGRIGNLAREGLTEARRSVMALRPHESRLKKLEAALRHLAERSTVPGRTTVTFEGATWATSLPPEHEHELLRIAQEAVGNALRHSQAQTIRIAIMDAADDWELRVADDGIGFSPELALAAQEGFGLTSMRERAAAIGAECRIESEPAAGTSVVVRVPKQRVG